MRIIISKLNFITVTMLAAGLLLAVGSSYAASNVRTVNAFHHLEVIGAVGFTNLKSGNGILGVTDVETDSLIQANGNNWDTFAAQLGVGHVHYLHGASKYSENLQWFPSIEPELNAYYLGKRNFTGEVWRYNSSEFNDMAYTSSLQSTRVMLDGALTIASKEHLSVYAKGGIGNAWNQLSYSDSQSSANAAVCPDQGLNLGSRTRANFAWEAGGGVTLAVNPRVMVSVEYLYADLGKSKTASSGNTGAITMPQIVPAQFNLNSQAVLFGLHVAQ